MRAAGPRTHNLDVGTALVVSSVFPVPITSAPSVILPEILLILLSPLRRKRRERVAAGVVYNSTRLEFPANLPGNRLQFPPITISGQRRKVAAASGIPPPCFPCRPPVFSPCRPFLIPFPFENKELPKFRGSDAQNDVIILMRLTSSVN